MCALYNGVYIDIGLFLCHAVRQPDKVNEILDISLPVSYTHLDVYKRQSPYYTNVRSLLYPYYYKSALLSTVFLVSFFSPPNPLHRSCFEYILMHKCSIFHSPAATQKYCKKIPKRLFFPLLPFRDFFLFFRMQTSLSDQPVVHFLVLFCGIRPGEILCHCAVDHLVPLAFFVVIDALWDHIIFMDKGLIAVEGSPKEVFESEHARMKEFLG